MRVLVLDTNIAYGNPTARVLLKALSKYADVLFGGLGYSLDTSCLSDIERRYGRIDVIVGQTWMYGEPEVGMYGKYVPKDLRDHPAPKILNLLHVDPYAVPEYTYQECIKPADAVISTVTSPQFIDNNMQAAASRESWIDPDLFFVRRTDLIDERWLLVPHCIADDEFVPYRVSNKKWDVIVPGVGYSFRRSVRDHLECSGRFSMTSMDGPLQRALYWATSYYRAQRHVDLTPWFNRRFRQRIAQCHVAVTCDASIGYAVRKYFEIPAFGALLAAKFFPQFDCLGFLDGTNCFAVGDGDMEQLDKIIEFARSDSGAARKLIDAGQTMVRDFHSADKRAQQLLLLLGAVCEGTLGRARWRGGKMIIQDSKEIN